MNEFALLLLAFLAITFLQSGYIIVLRLVISVKQSKQILLSLHVRQTNR